MWMRVKGPLRGIEDVYISVTVKGWMDPTADGFTNITNLVIRFGNAFGDSANEVAHVVAVKVDL